MELQRDQKPLLTTSSFNTNSKFFFSSIMNLIQESFEQMFHFYLLENKIQSLDPG